MRRFFCLLFLVIPWQGFAANSDSWSEIKASVAKDDRDLADLRNQFQEPGASCASATKHYLALNHLEEMQWQKWEKFVETVEGAAKGTESEATYKNNVSLGLSKEMRRLTKALDKMESYPEFKQITDDGRLNGVQGCTAEDYVLIMQYRKKMLSLFSKIQSIQMQWADSILDL